MKRGVFWGILIFLVLVVVIAGIIMFNSIKKYDVPLSPEASSENIGDGFYDVEQNSLDLTNIVNLKTIIDNKDAVSLTNKLEGFKVNGYIVQFKEKSIIERKVELENEIKLLKATGKNKEAENKEKGLQNTLVEHGKKIKEEKEIALNDIKIKLGKSDIKV